MNKPNHGRATHLVRSAAAPGASRRKPAQAAPVEAYAPGHFTELIKAHDWPPQWKAHMQPLDWRGDAEASRRASENRTVALQNGSGWAAGRVELPGTPKHQLMPGWMK